MIYKSVFCWLPILFKECVNDGHDYLLEGSNDQGQRTQQTGCSGLEHFTSTGGVSLLGLAGFSNTGSCGHSRVAGKRKIVLAGPVARNLCIVDKDQVRALVEGPITTFVLHLNRDLRSVLEVKSVNL